MSDMPPVFEIHACSHDLKISELDWTASDAAKSYAFTYGWVLASQARDLVKEIERLRARVEVLEETLGLLVDHQNGCPLPSYAAEWGRAMAMAKDLLEAKP